MSSSKTPVCATVESGAKRLWKVCAMFLIPSQLVETWPKSFPQTAVQDNLVSAAASGKTHIVKQFLRQKVDVNTRDDLGRTALIGASAEGHVPIIKELLTAGACVQAADYAGHTALMLATHMGHVEAVRWLLASGTGNTHWVDAAAAYAYARNSHLGWTHGPQSVSQLFGHPSNCAEQQDYRTPVDVKKEQHLLEACPKTKAKYVLGKPHRDSKASSSKALPGKLIATKKEPASTKPHKAKGAFSSTMPHKPVQQRGDSCKGTVKQAAKPKLSDLLNTAAWWDQGEAALKLVLKSLKLSAATKTMQKQSYLGNHADLLAHMKSTGKRKMTRNAVRTWLKKNDTFPAAYKQQKLSIDDCDIDHILPRSVGGIDHPYNYYILPRRLNRTWGGWWTAHKQTYMGAANAKSAKDFFLWVRDEGDRLQIDYNAFDQRRLAA